MPGQVGFIGLGAMGGPRAAGLNKEDGSAVVKVFERLAGVTVGRHN